MGSFANTLFTLLLGWLQGIISAVWSAFTTEDGQSLITWIGKHWIMIAGILCIAGLTVDLCVYLFRWKPFRVWKSFFTRDGEADEADQEEKSQHLSSPERRTPRAERRVYNRPVAVRNRPESGMEPPDLSQWENETKEESIPRATAPESPPLITNAGYSVPADSPYRRPVKHEPVQPEEDRTSRQEKPIEPEVREKETPVSMKARRRRRISVNELFSDPQEELIEFDAPQDIIDRKKAYHEPVYPQGWKKNEDDAK